MTLNDYAYTNRLKSISLLEKLFSCCGMLLLAVTSSSFFTWTIIIVIAHSLIVYAKIPFVFMVRIWLGPLAFLAVSCITVSVSVSFDQGLFVTEAGLHTALLLLGRSIACLSALLLLALTTPIPYLAGYVAQVEYLRPLAEIALLTYRFLFVFWEKLWQIQKAQECRLGYQNVRQSLRSLNLLAGVLGGKVFSAYFSLQQAMNSRNFQGRIIYRFPEIPIVKWRMSSVVLILILLFWLDRSLSS